MSKDKKEIIIYFIAKVIVGVLGLITVTLYSNLLSPEDYGEYSLISGLISALIAVLIGWIGSSSLRYYADYQDGKKEQTLFFSNVIIYSIVMTLVMMGIIFVVGLVSNIIPINKYFIATMVYMVNLSFMEVYEKIFRASQKTMIYAVGMVLQTLVSIIVFYLLVQYDIGANSILLSSAVSRFIFIMIAMFALKMFKNLRMTSFSKELLHKFLKFGIPMIGVWGISWVLSYCDRYIIALFLDNYEVGIYDMSYKISENSINVIITAFTLAVYPILIKIWNNRGKEAVELKIKEVIKYYVMLVLPAVLGIACIMDKLFLEILDSQYSSGKYVIIVVCIGMLFNGFNAILNKIWQLKEKTKVIFYVMLISVVFNIVLNIIFIPNFGIVGAAVTTLTSYLISNIITFILIKREFHIYIDYKSIFKTIFSSFFMVAFLIYFNDYVTNTFLLLVEIILAVVIYGIMSLILKNVSLKEVLNLKHEK